MRGGALQSLVLGVPKRLQAVSSCCSQVRWHHSQWGEKVLPPLLLTPSLPGMSPGCQHSFFPLPFKSYSSLGSQLIQKTTCNYAVILIILIRNHNCLLTDLCPVLSCEYREGREVVFLLSVIFLAPGHGTLALTITLSTFIE